MTEDGGSKQYAHNLENFVNPVKTKNLSNFKMTFQSIQQITSWWLCVGCGVCESACPNDVPVASLFNSLGGKLQEMFEYVPGEDPMVDPPVASFKEEELVEVAPNE